MVVYETASIYFCVCENDKQFWYGIFFHSNFSERKVRVLGDLIHVGFCLLFVRFFRNFSLLFCFIEDDAR